MQTKSTSKRRNRAVVINGRLVLEFQDRSHDSAMARVRELAKAGDEVLMYCGGQLVYEGKVK